MMWWLTRWNHSLFRICLAPGLMASMPCSSQPFVDVEAEILLAPQHARQGLAHNAGLIFV